MKETANDLGKGSSKRGNLGVYSSLVAQKRKLANKVSGKKGASKSQQALRPLPKEQPARFFAHFRWERIKAYWFSKDGLKRIGKICAACFLIGVIAVGALFVYYKNQLKEIQLNDLTIADTVNTYLDRNGLVLWEDKGTSDYRLVVEEDQISTYVRQATVALEDRNFYSHPGVDLMGLARAVVSTLTGRGVQGGSTLTQQLIKQVYFSDEALSANRGGISRKIKELILAIELEKMYSKEQIITMYLNESPYGGRRNGIESAAQTYFGKSAKDLTLAESALLAGIPNNPAVLDPYNEYGHEALIARQHKALDVMAEMGYITQEEANEAKEVPILDQVLPESNQYTDIKAPHFVLEVKKQLEEKYGIQTMRNGGFTIVTTLDYRAQEMAEAAVAEGDKLRYLNKSDNIALASVDVETAQVIAMVGSINWETPIYGEVNATTSLLEPGSTIKPLLDYAPLFAQNGEVVYGPGTVMKDENIDDYYCNGNTSACALRNYSGSFYGNVTLRQSLAGSLNINAVKALALTGIDESLEILHGLGDLSYCADNDAGGLSIAIGSGCRVKPVEHANAYASIARGGTYKELTYVLEVKDVSGKTLYTWEDKPAERVLDEQVAYLIADILSDAEARRITLFDQSAAFGFVVPGVWTGTKTGTTTTTNSSVTKDSWIASFSTAVATVIWNGNHDGSGLTNSSNTITRRVVNNYMENVHKNLYQEEGKWKPSDRPTRPSGIQELTVAGKTDLWPSWYSSEKSGIEKKKVEFNMDNYMQASDCTPMSKRIELDVTIVKDPISGTETVTVQEPYQYGEMDVCNTIPSDAVMFSRMGSILTIMFNDDSSYDLYQYQIISDGRIEDSGYITTSLLMSGLLYYLSNDQEAVVVRVSDSEGNSHDFRYNVGSASISN